MKKIYALIMSAVLGLGLVVIGTSAAHAGGSDSPTPYSVDTTGVTLPGGDTFPANGHVNIKYTVPPSNAVQSAGIHFDPNNNQPGGAWIGKNHIPWSAFGLTGEFCVTWVQIHGYNEHFGEGGQSPVCNGTPQETEKKVWVCKYVGTPGVDERLKDGKNPIEVSVNTLKGFTGDFPWEFPDAHGKSVAIGWASQNVSIADCPEPVVPVPPTAEAPVFVNAVCDAPGTITVPEVADVAYMISTAESNGAQARIYPGTRYVTEDFTDPATSQINATVTITAYWITDPTKVLGEWTHAFSVATDCDEDPEIPEQPQDKTGTEQRVLDPVCVVPEDGTATVTTEERTWTKTATWNETKQKWVFGKKVYGDWTVKHTETVDSENCIPAPPEARTGTEDRTNAPECVVPLNGTAEVTTEERTWTQEAKSWDSENQRWKFGKKVYGDWTVVNTDIVDAENCIPDAPESETRTEVKVMDPTCEDPNITTVTRHYVTPKVWDNDAHQWVNGTEEFIGSTEETVKVSEEWIAENCAPPITPETPVDEPKTVKVNGDTPPQSAATEDTQQLALTGGEISPWGLTAGAVAVSIGALALLLGLASRRRVE